ncbi:MMPL family transporter [Streptomyces sp. NPDC059153]|uniref:MMPL family transporter n=1 Tax=unclassified Streptomyces TaxID=2593676 RepID=UPI0036AC8993
MDHALFLVVRFRAALARHGDPVRAAGETMDTAGKAVALSGLTVLVSLSAVMLVPAPAFRSMALGMASCSTTPSPRSLPTTGGWSRASSGSRGGCRSSPHRC